MTTLRVSLHPAQRVIHNSPARFKVVAAGRRFGKTVYAVIKCLLEALRDTNDHGKKLTPDSEVVYIGVDREQAKRNAWNLFKSLGRPVIAKISEKDYVVTLVNGVRIRLLGMDDGGERIRGMKLRYAVLDEYADMPHEAWAAIIRPALMDVQGGAMFIGTPKGKNHFYQLHRNALVKPRNEDGSEPWAQWEAFNFSSRDNTTIAQDELQSMEWEYAHGSEHLLKQEVEAKFISKGGKVFMADWFKIDKEEPRDGSYLMTVDLAGFGTDGNRARGDIKKLDETAISIVKVNDRGWWVKEIQHGQWDVRETALRIVKAGIENECTTIGIEKGALANAVAPYMNDYQSQYNRYLNIVPVTHGNTKKYDRIQWALQGRAQKGQITLNKGPWNEVLIEQAVDFPDRRSHDDLLDSLAYIDQIAEHVYHFDQERLDAVGFEPLDALAGI